MLESKFHSALWEHDKTADFNNHKTTDFVNQNKLPSKLFLW